MWVNLLKIPLSHHNDNFNHHSLHVSSIYCTLPPLEPDILGLLYLVISDQCKVLAWDSLQTTRAWKSFTWNYNVSKWQFLCTVGPPYWSSDFQPLYYRKAVKKIPCIVIVLLYHETNKMMIKSQKGIII